MANAPQISLVHSVRRFNRYYTNILGLLDHHMLNSEYSLSEIRVLYEIENIRQCTSKKLIEELKMDSGYLSRIIKRFEKRGLVYKEQSPEDGRLFYLIMTDAGKKLMTDLNKLSDHQISQLVLPLQNGNLKKLADSMRIIENLLSGKPACTKDMVTIRNDLRPGDVGRLIQLHGKLYKEECGYNHMFEGYVCKTFYDFFCSYSPEKDRIWFAEAEGEIIGAIAILGHTPDKAQLRWFILDPDYRGLGLGKKLLADALQYCRDKNYRKVFLETTQDQKAAICMYTKAGFQKIAEASNNDWGRTLTEETYELQIS